LIVAGNVKDGPRGVRKYLAVQDAMRGESYVVDLLHEDGIVRPAGDHRRMPTAEVEREAQALGARAVGPEMPDAWHPHARGAVLMLDDILARGPVDLAGWEPTYGRLAEAQVKWEAAQGRALAP
jgi:tRNA threonylcarbamoyladenosine biosynthesis protein TsaB